MARPTSSYVVLGLLERWGPMTPYGLDGAIRRSVGYFWSFPRSQVYAEADRLVRQGLVREVREETGRRRRVLELTGAGAEALRRWRSDDLSGGGEGTQIHDEGLLRLFFADHPEVVAALAAEQVRVHEARLAEYERVIASGQVPTGSGAEATVRLGRDFERLAVAHWTGVASGVASGVAAGVASGVARGPRA